MSLKMFYADYCEGKRIDSSEAWTRTKEEILHSMDCVLHVPENFLGIIDGNDVTLQFMVNDDKTVQVDIPQVDRQGSLTMPANLNDCLDLVRAIGENIDVEAIEGLEFVAW